jgi:hypothetical protein
MTPRFILNAVSERPFTEGQRIARERVISQSRAFRQLVICDRIKQKRGRASREAQIILKKRKRLPLWWQRSSHAGMCVGQAQITDHSESIFGDMSKPYQIALFELDQFLKECANAKADR